MERDSLHSPLIQCVIDETKNTLKKENDLK